MNKKIIFNAIMVAMNLCVIAACTLIFLKYYSVVIYKKQTSQFMKSLSEMTVKSQQQEGVKTNIKIYNFDYRKPHPYSGFKTQPSTVTESTDHKMTIETNSYGHRSPELGKKQKGVVRIAIVGGSVAFQGQHNDTTIIGQLASLMGQSGLKVEFINTGVLSFVSEQEVAVLVHDLLDLDIDMLVSFDGFNDIHQLMYYNGRIGWPSVRWDNIGSENTHEMNQQVPSYYPKIEPRLDETTPDVAAAALDTYLHNIEKMARICEEFKIKYIACLQPWQPFKPELCARSDKVSNEVGLKDFFYCQAANKFAKWEEEHKYGATYVSLAGLFQNSKQLYSDECHFSDEGNSIVAHKLLDIEQTRHWFN